MVRYVKINNHVVEVPESCGANALSCAEVLKENLEIIMRTLAKANTTQILIQQHAYYLQMCVNFLIVKLY